MIQNGKSELSLGLAPRRIGNLNGIAGLDSPEIEIGIGGFEINQRNALTLSNARQCIADGKDVIVRAHVAI